MPFDDRIVADQAFGLIAARGDSVRIYYDRFAQ
jgi:hypothetical protein